nr:ribonuclease H-like domain-containing protein [Tanacetum cinerariifolium]
MTLQDPTWNMDTGLSSHLNSNASNLRTIFNQRLFPSVHVGDGNSIPVINTGHCTIPSAHHPIHLHIVLVTPNIIKNLISVRQFTRDNNCTIEFDVFGFSVKDFWTRHILFRCDSSGDLYPVTKPLPLHTAFVTTSSSTWHQRLGHPGDDVRVNMVRSMWLFKHKFHANGTLSCYKDRLVANGSSQQQVIDEDETFSPVVKPATICTILSLAVSRKWPIHQLDVKNAFLNAFSIWTETSTSCLVLAFCRLCHSGWVLSQSLRYFSFYLPTEKKYACELLEHANMVNCNPSRTPVDTDSKMGPEGVAVQDPTLYRSLAGGLLYLTFTRPNLSYAVQQIFLYMHDPRELHFAALKRILRAKAEYCGVANVVVKTAWLRNLLRELHSPLSTATLYADIFTKGLPTALFEDFLSSLSVWLPPAQTAGAY